MYVSTIYDHTPRNDHQFRVPHTFHLIYLSSFLVLSNNWYSCWLAILSTTLLIHRRVSYKATRGSWQKSPRSSMFILPKGWVELGIIWRRQESNPWSCLRPSIDFSSIIKIRHIFHRLYNGKNTALVSSWNLLQTGRRSNRWIVSPWILKFIPSLVAIPVSALADSISVRGR